MEDKYVCVIHPNRGDIRPKLEDRNEKFHWLKSSEGKVLPAEYRDAEDKFEASYFLPGEIYELVAALGGNAGWKYLGVCKYERKAKP